ncbi:MAG: M3 family oligoendopeptidase [Beijerinckiaceae bacterium]
MPLNAPAEPAAAAMPDLGVLPRWNLADLYPGMDSPELKADLAQAETDTAAFVKTYRGQLEQLTTSSDGAHALAGAVNAYEALEDRLGRVMSYAGLVYCENTTDPQRAKFYGDMQEKLTALSSELLFFTLEINRLDDALIAQRIKEHPLAHYAPWIDDLRREKPHQLSDDLEKLFLEKSMTGASAWNRLFDETIAHLRFTIDGKELPIEQTLNFLQDADEHKRKQAADALAATFKANLRTFALITNTLAKDKDISDRWRGFKDIADARHLSNRIEPEVVDALVSAVRTAYPRISHRYYKMKARWFGKESLNHWDRNAPLPKADHAPIAWPQARTTVLDAYGQFSPELAAIAKRFFDERWIDAPTEAGKAPGAFAHPTVPSAHPYVLLNYQGKPRDVMTLAHELGHGVHQVLAAPNGALMAQTPLTLAETASVFGEMLTFRKLLSATTDSQARKALLAGKAEDMINTVVRQIAFYSFERKIHTARKEGELTAEQICDIWLSVQSESLGPAITIGPGYETFWAYIPHFIHSPFYVYAYAFGDCLVNSLYGVYQKADPKFVDHYFALLRAGGTRHYNELLRPFGLDAREPAFWDIGLGMIEGIIDELESMEQMTG